MKKTSSLRGFSRRYISLVSESEVEAFIVRSILLELDLTVFLCGNFTATLLLFFVLGKVVQDFGAVTRDSTGDFGDVASGHSVLPLQFV